MPAVDIDPQPITNWFLLVLAVGGVVTLISGVVIKVNRKSVIIESRLDRYGRDVGMPVRWTVAPSLISKAD